MAASTSPAAGPPKLTNLYNLREVGTPKSCYICGKETAWCLANADVSDFLYSCKTHLSDPGFARAAPSSTSASPATSAPPSPGASSPAVPQSEIDKVKREYEEKAKLKKEAAANADSKESSSSGWVAGSLKTGFSTLSSAATATASTLFPPPPPVTPSPSELARLAAKDAKVFVLNRDIFRMRVEGAKKRWQAKEAKERVKGLSLPSAPRGGL